MHGILSNLCRRTITSLNIGRLNHGKLEEICRNINLTSTSSFHHSIINRTKDESGDNRDDQGVHNSEVKSGGTWAQYTTQRYERFAEHSSHIIYDFDEEQKRLEEGIEEEVVHEEEVVLHRGVTGVFDVEELVDLLREENAKDIAVMKIPREIKYADFMVIVTSTSQRHINALSQLIRRVYKKKKNKRDQFLILEGKNTEWVAVDMGNIVLHIMTENVREDYDLETLWTVGVKYDDKSKEEESNQLEYFDFLRNPLKDSSASQISSETT